MKSLENKMTECDEFEDDSKIRTQRSGGSEALTSHSTESTSDNSEIKALCARLQDTIETLSIEFENFSNKLDSLCVETANLEREDLYSESYRVPLPTSLNGVRMSADSFIKVLKSFPVPNGRDRNHELTLRSGVILSHYENRSAMKHFEELKSLPLEHEAENLVRNSSIRTANTKNILLRRVGELVRFNESYRDFVNEYLIALDSPPEPEHESLDYLSAFEKMINNQQRYDEVKVPHHNYESLKNSIVELEHIVKKLASGIRKGLHKSKNPS